MPKQPAAKSQNAVDLTVSSDDSVTQRPSEHVDIVQLLSDVARHDDAVFRELTLRRIASFAHELRQLAGGRIAFANTETWRSAYELVLLSLDSAGYRSVSWVKTEDYWGDLPGRQSMKLNYELLAKGLHIERILILGWNLWPPESQLPVRSIRQWIEDQHFRGIDVRLVRESDLVSESDLLRDFGIYGDRATGEQETDSDSRTMRFVLCFDLASIRLAQDRWERLKLFAQPYGEILDHGLSIA